MAITKDKKKEIVQKLRDVVAKAESVVFVTFSKIRVSEENELRRKLRENQSGYMVVKKSLLSLVLGDQKMEGEIPPLHGEIAIAYGEDAVLPAKHVQEFGKKMQEKVAILGGIFGGKFLSAREMNELASIPSRHTLLGMFANVINSPVSGLVIALDAIAKTKTATE